MLKNYIITAWRNLLRNKVFSFINITGLSIGIASCLLIYLYLKDETSYDTHWRHADRIVRINWEETSNGVTDPFATISFGAGPSIKENFPEVEEVVRILQDNSATVSRNGLYFNEKKQFSVDSNFLSVFNFELLAGNANTCLKEPHSVVISEEMAGRYFGKADPMGGVLQYPQGSYKITGVLKADQKQSHFKPNALLSIDYNSADIKEKAQYLLWLDVYTYVKLKNISDLKGFDAKLAQWSHKVLDPVRKENNVGYTIVLKSEPVADVHFDNYHKDQFEKSDRSYIYIFGWIAGFILLIACFNYMNLSTARATKRAREVGVRKVSGASRNQLFLQFMGESLIISFIALLVAVFLLFGSMPFFNTLTGKSIIPLTVFTQSSSWILLILVFIFISLVGGSYPALYLSGFKPVTVLKGKIAAYRKSYFNIRQTLVVSQFVISGIVIICTLVVYSQLTMMKNKDLGFNKDQVLVIRLPWLDSLNSLKALTLKHTLAGNSAIKKISTAHQVIGASGNNLFRIKENGNIRQASINVGTIDYNYFNLLDIQLAKGRNFSKDYGTDQQNFILNEAAVKFLRLKDPMGAELSRNDVTYGKVVGVVKDYNYKSPHSKIEPMVFTLDETGYYIFAKLSPQNLQSSIAAVSQEWKKIFPHNPIAYYFLDELFNEQYKSENIMLILLACFSGLTILISCLGLFGLATFLMEQRTREIGIRKVVGASVSGLVYHLSKDFLVWVFLASVIASPIAYYFLSSWLQHFAYRITISVWIFAATGFLTLLIAFLTMSWQTVRAARANPVKSLRTE